MPQDAFTLRYLCDELNNIFKGGKVNRIIQPSNDILVLTVYTGKRTEKLLLNVNPSAPRIGVIEEEMDSPLTAPNFCMLMRKHLLSSTIQGVSLVGFDRIVKIDFLTSAEFSDSVLKTVYVELMGRYSNIILTENGKIAGGNRGINMFDNGVRPLIVGQKYVFPPVGDKKLPSDKSLIKIFDGINSEDIAKVIFNYVQGIAKTTADEIAYFYMDKYPSVNTNEDTVEFVNGEKLFDILNDYLFNTEKNPVVYFEEGEITDVSVYPYKLIKGEKKSFDYLYKADDFYFKERDRIKNFRTKRERLNSVLKSHIKKVKKRLCAICAKENDALSAEENRIKGELILSNIYKIRQGDKEIILDNYYDGSKVKIILDEYISPSKNAEKFYKKYNKQKRTLIALKPQKELAERELDYFLSVSDEILLCENINDLYLVQNELEKEGLFADRQVYNKKKKEQESFCNNYEIDGFVIKAGRNNAENDKLTFTAKSNDMWLHARDYHSSHVIIESGGKEIPEKVLIISAEICAYFSKGRSGGKTEIVYTERKNVKKPSKAKMGFVTYENFNSIMVLPQKHAEFLKCK